MNRNKILIIVLGVVFIGVGIFSLYRENYLKKNCTVEAVGTVVEVVEEENYDDENNISYTYYPVIEYKALDKTMSEKGTTGGSRSTYTIGQKIDILYNPDKPEEFIIKGDHAGNIVGIVAIVGGIICVIAGFVMRSN